MTVTAAAAAIILVLFPVVIWKMYRGRLRRRAGDIAERPRLRRGTGVGPGAAGAVYGMLNEDRRAALEIILEERAAYRDPEDRDGNLPDLQKK